MIFAVNDPVESTKLTESDVEGDSILYWSSFPPPLTVPVNFHWECPEAGVRWIFTVLLTISLPLWLKGTYRN